MQTASKKWNGAGRFDPINSTFKHVISLKTTTGIKDITGYSKGLLSVESSDKTVLLERLILRLVNSGYLFGKHKKYGSETVQINYFLNGTFEGIPDELIFTLYPDEYVFSKDNDDFFDNVRLHTFLKRLYSQRKSGELVTKSLTHKAILKNYDELFDTSKKRFVSESDLYNYCQIRIKEGHPRGEVFNFYTKYFDKWLVEHR